ncbi:MAG: SAM-dependent methyltransferase [Thermodesulfovibrionales bacterium]|nr:SAM-dependent methyltransferase [Thermodesulfovibrionales bacterium]
MTPLETLIHNEIKIRGCIPFDYFMELALYTKELGYYMTDETTIGIKGDFYTSPSIHQLFATMIAKQIEEMWHILDKPKILSFIECGGGMGFFAKDFLEYIKNKPISDALQYIIVEKNPHLKKRQSVLLAEHNNKTMWIEDISELDNITGVLFCNELFDAFPVRLIQKKGNLIFEIWLALKENSLLEQLHPLRQDSIYYINEFCPNLYNSDFPDGYTTEINLVAKDWLKQASAVLKDGFIITIDYGYNSDDYYSSERTRGTLLCYHKHQINENPYINIGKQDITAHVNFSALKRWAEEFGLRNCGFCSQGMYLVSLGIDEAIIEMYGQTPDPFQIAKIKGLILPQGLGQSHKVLIQYKGNRDFKLKGFQISNRLAYL